MLSTAVASLFLPSWQTLRIKRSYHSCGSALTSALIWWSGLASWHHTLWVTYKPTKEWEIHLGVLFSLQSQTCSRWFTVCVLCCICYSTKTNHLVMYMQPTPWNPKWSLAHTNIWKIKWGHTFWKMNLSHKKEAEKLNLIFVAVIENMLLFLRHWVKWREEMTGQHTQMAAEWILLHT